MFAKAQPALSEESCVRESFVSGVHGKTCGCVRTVVLANGLWTLFSLARGLYLRENSIGHVGENLAGRVRGRLDDCVRESRGRPS